ncbi:unnamed protein product [Prorocentrum cordatum]|uniref:Uncharacterized protein n=1 Tax=Prorocentrum cordatum TaxID=2364126 RepID=A0ABN9VHC5_9DINO|nr:unnamed protein product [Polarella glacialis]
MALTLTRETLARFEKARLGGATQPLPPPNRKMSRARVDYEASSSASDLAHWPHCDSTPAHLHPSGRVATDGAHCGAGAGGRAEYRSLEHFEAMGAPLPVDHNFADGPDELQMCARGAFAEVMCKQEARGLEVTFKDWLFWNEAVGGDEMGLDGDEVTTDLVRGDDASDSGHSTGDPGDLRPRDDCAPAPPAHARRCLPARRAGESACLNAHVSPMSNARQKFTAAHCPRVMTPALAPAIIRLLEVEIRHIVTSSGAPWRAWHADGTIAQEARQARTGALQTTLHMIEDKLKRYNTAHVFNSVLAEATFAGYPATFCNGSVADHRKREAAHNALVASDQELVALNERALGLPSECAPKAAEETRIASPPTTLPMVETPRRTGRRDAGSGDSVPDGLGLEVLEVESSDPRGCTCPLWGALAAAVSPARWPFEAWRARRVPLRADRAERVCRAP